MKTVGEFSFDEAKGTISGPASYMEEQGNALIDRISRGEDQVLAISAQYSPDIITAILVRVQTDYAGWKGMRDFNAMRARCAQ